MKYKRSWGKHAATKPDYWSRYSADLTRRYHEALLQAQERWWRNNPAAVDMLMGSAMPGSPYAGLAAAVLYGAGEPPQDVLEAWESRQWSTPTCGAESGATEETNSK